MLRTAAAVAAAADIVAVRTSESVDGMMAAKISPPPPLFFSVLTILIIRYLASQLEAFHNIWPLWIVDSSLFVLRQSCYSVAGLVATYFVRTYI